MKIKIKSESSQGQFYFYQYQFKSPFKQSHAKGVNYVPHNQNSTNVVN